MAKKPLANGQPQSATGIGYCVRSCVVDSDAAVGQEEDGNSSRLVVNSRARAVMTGRQQKSLGVAPEQQGDGLLFASWSA